MANSVRCEERICTTLPVNIGSITGITRDVSASGIFFEADASLSLGSPIHFTVELDTPGGRMELRCLGDIVRTEARPPRVGIAVKITESAMVRPERV